MATQLLQPYPNRETFANSRHLVVGGTLAIALVAFEIFNFDTTRYALQDLLGEVSFVGIKWASILAVAFCAIDFAGLARIFAPEHEDRQESWYLMGAWLLGATMNAMMTWWAVSLTLLNHGQIGNEVLGREALLRYVPIFVAILVWLTRILFIGAMTVAGDRLLRPQEERKVQGVRLGKVGDVRPQEGSARVVEQPAEFSETPSAQFGRLTPTDAPRHRPSLHEKIAEEPTLFITPKKENATTGAATAKRPVGKPTTRPNQVPPGMTTIRPIQPAASMQPSNLD